ncbi:unnamed protein product [Knipowitschia caucasica]
MESSLLHFLRQRNIGEALISELEKDKIDTAVIPLMSDHDLEKYVPQFGDRVALVAFCRRNQPANNKAIDRKHLLEKVRSKIGNPPKKRKEKEDISAKLQGNVNAKKKDRRLELGWMNYELLSGTYKPIRTAKGGGTRHVTLERNTCMREIQILAENLFFPEGKSKYLKLEGLKHEMRDIQENVIDEECTIDELYEKTKVKSLRVYLCTRKKGEDIHDTESNAIILPPKESQTQTIGNPLQEYIQVYVLDEEWNSITTDKPEKIETTFDLVDSPIANQEEDTSGGVLIGDIVSEEEEIKTNTDLENTPIANQHEDRPGKVKRSTVSANEKIQTTTDLENIPAADQHEDHSGEVIPLTVLSNEMIQTTTDLENRHAANQYEDSFGEVFIGPNENEVFNLDDTLPQEERLPVVLEVRRGFCLTDLMSAFGDPSIMNKDMTIAMKLPNGSFEKGSGSGVFRDCLCEFWNEFYNRCTVGDTVKVPFLRHEYQIHEWQAIGRILVKGWPTAGYFPIRISLPFLEEALYCKTYSSIKESFLLYISKSDRQIIEGALNNFGSVEQDALIDVLDSHECHQIPTEENICSLVAQLGHKALIQTPMFVIECWRPVLKTIADTLNPQQLKEIVQQQVPTSKRVRELLRFPQLMNAAQTNVSKHLKRYVGELDEKGLQLFLRFCTGADVLFGSHITVHFIETSDFRCRPQASTCGCFLNLPINYQNYPDLRSDFNAILNSSVWVMDII